MLLPNPPRADPPAQRHHRPLRLRQGGVRVFDHRRRSRGGNGSNSRRVPRPLAPRAELPLVALAVALLLDQERLVRVPSCTVARRLHRGHGRLHERLLLRHLRRHETRLLLPLHTLLLLLRAALLLLLLHRELLHDRLEREALRERQRLRHPRRGGVGREGILLTILREPAFAAGLVGVRGVGDHPRREAQGGQHQVLQVVGRGTRC
mmetsp:Transcript_55569/g.132439  ORF Transcript_55569/g.132439 Transcript_55569/m.132439 type:complete len:207 (+) Transcript_55569:223-843(+)